MKKRLHYITTSLIIEDVETIQTIAGWSSLVARRAHNPKVVGSNPAPATNFYLISYVVAGWSSLVARRAHNPKVVGSNPAPATNLLKMQTLKAAWNIKLKVFCTLMRDGAVW